MNTPRGRRRYQRITPIKPVAGKMQNQRIHVVDISVSDACVAHQTKFGDERPLVLSFDWDGQHIRYECDIARTEIYRYSREEGKTIYHSGLEFRHPLGESRHFLHEMITEHVLRALDEQKANARGIPPRTTTYLQTSAKNAGYLCCQFENGAWRKTTTQKPAQPVDGFTISATESPEQVDMLCDLYARSDKSGRDIIRQTAAISVSSTDGFATRRFEP